MNYTMNVSMSLDVAKAILPVLYPDSSKEVIDNKASLLARKFKLNEIEYAMLRKVLHGVAPVVPDFISDSLQDEVIEDLKDAIKKFVDKEYASYKCLRPYTSAVCDCANEDDSFFYSLDYLGSEDVACLLADTEWCDTLRSILVNTEFLSVMDFVKRVVVYKGYAMCMSGRCDWEYADSEYAHKHIESIARMISDPTGHVVVDYTKLGIFIGCDVTGNFEKHDIDDGVTRKLEGLGLTLTNLEAAIVACTFWVNNPTELQGNVSKIIKMLCDIGRTDLADVFWDTYQGILDKVIDLASVSSSKKKHSHYADSSSFNNDYAKRIEEMVSTKVADCLWLSDAAKEGCDNFDIVTIKELLGTEFNIVLSFMSVEDLCYLNGMQRSAVSNGCSLFVVD